MNDLVMIRQRRLLDAGHSSSRHDPLLPQSDESEQAGVLSASGNPQHIEEEQDPHTAAAASPTAPPISTLEMLFPCYKWLKTYSIHKDLFTDLISGISVAIMVIPQSMSYAKLAGLPIVYGLYSAMAPIVAYAIYGSSNQLAVGPVAMVSLLFHNGVAQIILLEEQTNDIADSNEDSSSIQRLTVQSAAIVGMSYLLLYTFRLGWITTFLSHSVISGFTTGAAVLIGLSQLKHLLGYSIEGSTILEIAWNTMRGLNNLNWWTLSVGGSFTLCLILVKGLKHFQPKLEPIQTAGPLLVTIAALSLPNDANVLPMVGDIPQGLPSFTISKWWPPHEHLIQFIPTILSIVMVGFMESIAIAKQLAIKNNQDIDANAELLGLGMANLWGGAFHSYPITGSFSRSAVNSNAHSPLSGAVTATTVGLVLVFLTPMFESLPLCALAAIVISGVYSVMDTKQAFGLYELDRGDFAVWITACFGVLFLGVEAGLAAAIVVSFAVLIPWRPSVKRMVRCNESTSLIDHDRLTGQMVDPSDRVLVVRLTSSIHFANVNWVISEVNNYLEDGHSCIILDMTSVSSLDTSARIHLRSWLDERTQQNLRVYYAGCSDAVQASLRHTLDNPHARLFQMTVNHALQATEDDSTRYLPIGSSN